MRAAANTPAERVGACVARFPTRSSLPRVAGGSASASQVSGPARRSLALRPAWSLSRPRRPLSSECFGRYRCLHRPLRLLPAGATVAGRDSHPLRDDAFHGAPPQAASASTIPTSAIHFSARQLPLAKIAPVRMSQSPLFVRSVVAGRGGKPNHPPPVSRSCRLPILILRLRLPASELHTDWVTATRGAVISPELPASYAPQRCSP